MTIIVDLHAFSNHFTGKHHYTLNLLSKFCTHPQARKHHFIFASPQQLSFNKPQQLTWVKLSSNPLHYYLQLVWLARKHPGSLLVSPTSFITPLLCRLPFVQIVYDFAAWQSASFKHNRKATLLERLLLPLISRHGQLIISISSYTQTQLKKYFPTTTSKTITIPPTPKNLPNPQITFPLLKKHKLKSNAYYLFVGTLEPRKNLPRLLKAYHRYTIELGSQAQPLLIAGKKGWDYEDIFTTYHHLKLEKMVHFLGPVSEQTLASLYHHAYALVYPSLYEGFGLPIIEAISFGKPVITSHNSALSSAACDCVLKIDPLNQDSLYQALSRLHRDQKLYERLASSIPAKPSLYPSQTAIDQLWLKLDQLDIT